MQQGWWLKPLYCLLAVLPLGAAFAVYGRIPAWVESMPGVYVSTGRGYIWVLPLIHVVLAAGLSVLTRQMSKGILARMEERGQETDLLQVVPWIRLFLLLWLTAICLAVVYGRYVLDAGQLTLSLIGRVSAVIPGVGVSAWGLQLSDASLKNLLALRFRYMMQSPQVWLSVHKLAARVLYITGAIMVGTGFLLEGIRAVALALLALVSALFALYLYAKHLYENEFYR